MRTVWGYDVDGVLSPIILPETFHYMTNNAYVGNNHVEAALEAASQAIRNYCGWHVCPAEDCTANPVGGAMIAKLPAGYVSAINSITENGVTLTADDYQWRKDGLIRKKCQKWSDDWDAIEVSYTAGYSEDAVPDLKEAVCSIASGVLTVAAGVSSESADGVSISYQASASSVAASLTSQMKSALEPYRVVNSHAA